MLDEYYKIKDNQPTKSFVNLSQLQNGVLLYHTWDVGTDYKIVIVTILSLMVLWLIQSWEKRNPNN